MDIYTCPKCETGTLRQHVTILVNCPADQKALDKKAIRKAGVEIVGAYWDRAIISCAHCGAIGLAKGGGEEEQQTTLRKMLDYARTGAPSPTPLATVTAEEVQDLVDTLPDNYTATKQVVLKYRR